MNTIKVKTLDQKLMITSAPMIVSGDKNIDFVEFDFDPSWDEFTERYCVFYLTADDPYQVNIDDNNRCGIVQAMTEQEGVFYFGVWGRSINGDKIKTSTNVEYRVERGVPTDGATISSWDDFWASIKSCHSMFTENALIPHPPTFNTYSCTSFYRSFKNTSIESVSIAIPKATTLENAFADCYKLKSVTLIEPTSSLTTLKGAFQVCASLEQIMGELNATNFAPNAFDYAFTRCSNLKEFRLKPYTLSVYVDLSPCSALSRESVLSVLAACRQIESTQTVKFASAVYSADISEQIMAAVNKGWTVAFGSTQFKPTEV